LEPKRRVLLVCQLRRLIDDQQTVDGVLQHQAIIHRYGMGVSSGFPVREHKPTGFASASFHLLLSCRFGHLDWHKQDIALPDNCWDCGGVHDSKVGL
jgi:hypothetical protein